MGAEGESGRVVVGVGPAERSASNDKVGAAADVRQLGGRIRTGEAAAPEPARRACPGRREVIKEAGRLKPDLARPAGGTASPPSSRRTRQLGC